MKAALALAKKRGLLTEAELASFVAGEPVVGSWWGHAAGKQIFEAMGALDDAPDLLLCKLVEGRRTFVHRRLWPALIRAQREPSLWPPLSAPAKTLLAQLRAAGELRASGKPRIELERTLRAIGRNVHTPSGKHEVVLVPFDAAFPPEALAEAEALSREDALTALATAGFTPGPKPKPKRR